MASHSEIAKKLTQALTLATPPIAVSFADHLPEGVAMWSGHAPAGCRFWQEAATRVFATTAADHSLCPIGLYTHNLGFTRAAETDLNDTLKIFAELTYVRPEDVAAIPVLKSQPKYVIYGPLAEAPLEPDAVLLFVQPGQTLILSEASQQIEAGFPPAMGRPACAVIPQAVNTGRSALSLGCCGARAYLDVLSYEVALYALPGPAIAAFAERIEALANANQILQKFHEIRRREVEAGRSPSVLESLAALKAED